MHSVEAAGHDLPATADFLYQAGGESVIELSGVGRCEGYSEAAVEACFVDEAVVQGVEHVLGLGFRLRELVVILAWIGAGVDALDIVADGVGVERPVIAPER